MIDQSSEKQDPGSPSISSEDLSYANQDRCVTTTTSAGTAFRAWQMPYSQDTIMDCEHDSKCESWQDTQHRESYASLFCEEEARPQERGNVAPRLASVSFT